MKIDNLNAENINGLNGIIISGKVYELDPTCISCTECDLQGECFTRSLENTCLDFRNGQDGIFRYSQELTDKLNGYE